MRPNFVNIKWTIQEGEHGTTPSQLDQVGRDNLQKNWKKKRIGLNRPDHFTFLKAAFQTLYLIQS